ncbi:DUF2642 domain-containing protein [Paenibacillus cremeus]|uniref:DUF2642 domain-containing protein n=1 Tax=Paenibacillus cremeus TaxID=2163881 RepID=A0A559KIH4_9BACL|nr:DUF2642 domain-containing protein [Paenibacillus cremeus]TVY11943.1 DUF2642 domain-containing protein [Paenibacillus cremeus]
MKAMRSFINQSVEIAVSGKKDVLRGTLIDIGNDILVLHMDTQFIYVPLLHLQQLSPTKKVDEIVNAAEINWEPTPDLSYRKVLMNAKGMFTELFITGNQSIHGYITSIMNDFFVFHSPVFHSVLVSMRHLKCLIPYELNATPYAMSPSAFPLNPKPIALARNIDQQLKKFEGQFAVLNLGESSGKIGLLKTADSPIIEIVTASGESAFMHIDHVKTVHFP